MSAASLIGSPTITWEDRPNQKVTSQLFSRNLAEIFAQNIKYRYGDSLPAKVVKSRSSDGWRVLVPANEHDPSTEMLRFPNIQTVQAIEELRVLSGKFPFSVPKITYVETYEEEEPYNNMKERLLYLDELSGLKVAFNDVDRKIAYCEGRTTLERLSLFPHRYFHPFYRVSNASRVDYSDFERDLENLLRDSRDFFHSVRLYPIQPKPYAPGNDAQMIAELLELECHQGFCIGEIHNKNSGRRFLIENMQTLREQGVTTLFMEFLHYDTMQDLLDSYFNSVDESISGYLGTHLAEFDDVREGMYKCDPAYGCAKIIECAKKAGIRVVGIDTALSAECGRTAWGATEPERLLGMNFVAQQIIQQEMGTGKFVAFMGRDHVKRGEDPVPTVPEILNIPGIYMEATPKGGASF